MTQLMEKAYHRISQLPEEEQDSVAALILDTLEDEEVWSQKFAASQNTLSRLAQKALIEHRARKTLPLDPHTSF